MREDKPKQNDSILEGIESPADLQDLSAEDLKTLAGEVRDLIIKTVAKRGGHLASSLGVVELTVALLKVFSPQRTG